MTYWAYKTLIIIGRKQSMNSSYTDTIRKQGAVLTGDVAAIAVASAGMVSPVEGSFYQPQVTGRSEAIDALAQAPFVDALKDGWK